MSSLVTHVHTNFIWKINKIIKIQQKSSRYTMSYTNFNWVCMLNLNERDKIIKLQKKDVHDT